MSYDAKDYGEEFQQLMLSVLVSEPDIFVRCQNILKPEYFHNRHAMATKYLLEYANEYHTLPTIPEIQLKSGISLQKVEDINAEHHAGFLDTIEEFCRYRAIEHAVVEGMKYVKSKQYGKVEELVKEAMLVSLQKDLGTDYTEDPKARNERLFSAQGTIKTGWAEIDHKLFGGFGKAELEIFVAPSGGGKSVCLQNVSKNFSKNGMNGVYITLELKEELVAQRMDTMITGLGKKDILRDMDAAALAVQMKCKGNGAFWIKRMPESITTVNDIKAYLKELKIKTGTTLDYIAVDYLDLLATPRADSSDTFNKDKFVCEELRALAHELDIVVITASQLNRTAVEATDFNHANIAGGISKIYTADNVIGIMNTPSFRERGEIQFQFMKTRNSSAVGQKVQMSYNIDTLEIGDHPDWTAQQSGVAPTQYTSAPKNANIPALNAVASASAVNSASQAAQSVMPTKPGNPLSMLQQKRNMMNSSK